MPRKLVIVAIKQIVMSTFGPLCCWPPPEELGALVRRAQQGEDHARDDLLTRLRSPLLAYFSYRVPSDLAEDPLLEGCAAEEEDRRTEHRRDQVAPRQVGWHVAEDPRKCPHTSVGMVSRSESQSRSRNIATE